MYVNSFMCVFVFYFKDSIEANVESAEVHVQQANQQLSRAANYQVTVTVTCFLITETFELTVCGDCKGFRASSALKWLQVLILQSYGRGRS